MSRRLRDRYRYGRRVGTLAMSECIGIQDEFRSYRGWLECYTQDLGCDRELAFSQAILHNSEENLIVTLARKAMTHLVAEGDTDYQITEFQAGTGGHAPGDPLTPVDPVVGDTGLETSFWSKAITLPPVYAPVGEESNVKLTVVMDTSEGNDVTPVQYTEAGLFSDNGNLFARQTFPAVVKIDTRRITFEWTLYF